MMTLTRTTPRASRMREVEGWIRSIVGRAPPGSPRVPRVLAGVAIFAAGAAAALLLSPKNGREMRAITRERIDGLHRRARSFATRDWRRAANGRAGEPRLDRSRRTEATS